MRRLLVVAAACASALCACALPSATAFAHEGNPNFRSDVHGLAPRTDGVTVEVLNRDDRLLLTNRSDRTIEIEGYSDDPYARLRPDGTVEVNHNSAAYYLNTERDGDVPVPARVQRGLPPDWRVQSGTGKFEWHDHRMHWMGQGTPPAVKDESKTTRVDDWSVPIAVDGEPGEITGTLWWTPTPGGGPPVAAIAGLAALLVAGGAFVVFVRRRRRGDGGDDAAPAASAAQREAW
jgi:hypothetical protein